MTTEKKYKCVCFDMDGTILDTVEDCALSINLTLEHFGYPKHTVDEVRSYLNNGGRKLVERALPKEVTCEVVDKVLEKYLEIYSLNVCVNTKPYEGIPGLIGKLKENNIKLAIVSNKPHRQAEKLAEICFGKDTFEYVSGSGEGMFIKPDKRCVEMALEKMKVKKEETLYVGDSYVDVLTAQNALVDSVGVLWGLDNGKSFEKNAPDFIVKDVLELEKIILGE